MRTFSLCRTDRECNESITVNGISFDKGTIFTVPIYAIHHDAEIYPDPEKFDPERYFYVLYGWLPLAKISVRALCRTSRLVVPNNSDFFRFGNSRPFPYFVLFPNGSLASFCERSNGQIHSDSLQRRKPRVTSSLICPSDTALGTASATV